MRPDARFRRSTPLTVSRAGAGSHILAR
jgi:hypothetical protein